MSREKNPTRDRILASALHLLEQGAGQSVRMSDIAKAAGISRQALYLHFPNRADLLVAATRHLDDISGIEERLGPSRSAATGIDRLAAWVEVWGNYIPVIHGVGRALMAMQDTDPEAREAWADRMGAVRHGCAAAVAALKSDGDLAEGMTETEATDLLWTMLSVRTWDHLRADCGWSQARYVEMMQRITRKALVRPPG